MMAANPTKKNHYVSQGYLKKWESSPGKIMVYRVLVSHGAVPVWTEKSIEYIGYKEKLYTLNLTGSENDEIERWFCDKFESLSNEVIQKAINGRSLSKEDWQILVRFLAMHDVRTPARLVEYLKNASDSTREALENTVHDLLIDIGTNKKNEVELPLRVEKNADFPLRVTTKISEGEKFGTLSVETAVGRASWLWAIKHLLNNAAKILHNHRWTIMRPAKGMSWFTSDKPVMRLNYYGPGKYDFKGGWGKVGTEIFMPLSPEHMLYTQVDVRPPERGSRFSVEQTKLLRRLISEHAHRFIFSKSEEEEIEIYRPRIVDSAIYKQEQEQWEKWHSEQVESEQYLFSRDR